jgi:hypothetical protein
MPCNLEVSNPLGLGRSRCQASAGSTLKEADAEWSMVGQCKLMSDCFNNFHFSNCNIERLNSETRRKEMKEVGEKCLLVKRWPH